MKVLKYLILFTVGMLGTVLAGSMTFSPSTGDFYMYCKYSGEILVDGGGYSVYAIDSKIFSTNIVLSNFSGSITNGTYGYLGVAGLSLYTVTYPWSTYTNPYAYYYVNWYADGGNLLHTSGALASYLFESVSISTTGYLDFYYLSGGTFDASVIQSVDVNTVVNVLDYVNSGYFDFVPLPCVSDVDAPMFTGYSSGALYNASVDPSFSFVIYDYTGSHVVDYNDTEHYWFTSLPADETNLANYVAVTTEGVDNQYGVNSGSISMYISGVAEIIPGTLLSPIILTGLDCVSGGGEGNLKTWNQNDRGYTCVIPFSSLNLQTSQSLLVVITGTDLPNIIGDIHTGSTSYIIDYRFSTPIPPPGGGRGGGLLSKDDCLLPSNLPGANEEGIDYSYSYYDNDCGPQDVHEAANYCPVDSDAPYDQELIEAFQFAYEVGITNKCPIDDARLSDNIRRKELVKMLVYFAVKVMGVMPDENKLGCDQYADLDHASNELKYYTKLGCQLELMGMKPDGITPMENFLPDDFVTRAQFGTTLSRLIFGRKYAGYEPHWYSKHLVALKEFGIIKLTIPDLLERRGFIMLMFKRTSDSGLVEQYRLSAAAKNGATALK